MKKKNIKNKNLVFIITGVVLILAITIVLLILLNNKKGEEKVVTDAIFLGDYSDEIKTDKKVLTSYNEYLNVFEEGKVEEKAFDNNNYAVVEIAYDSCTDKDIKINSYEVDNNVLKVTASYTANCGVCAPYYMYYLLPVDKTVTDLSVEINYVARNKPDCDPNVAYKPIIYLYPEEDMDVEVKLTNSENIFVSYPRYNDGWKVYAKTNGDLYDKVTNRYYYALYWEGNNHRAEVKEDGFVVKKEDTLAFLEEKLALLGLNEREANEFIVYWLPKLEANEYNYIRFETMEEINSYMKLEINPNPDTIIRVLMDYKALDKPIEVKEQVLNTPKRVGFTVVEWGGSEIK